MSHLRAICFSLFLAALLVTVPARAEKIPDFSTSDVSSGKKIDTTNLRGQVLLLNFWATWCGPCRKELPELDRLYREYSSRGFTVIGISVDRLSKSRISNFVRSRGISYPVIKGSATLSRRYGGISAIPASFLVGRDGEIIKKMRGYASGKVLRALIEKALSH